MAKILIVEDLHPQQDGVAALLSANGYQTVEAAAGEETLRAFGKEKPDLVIMDACAPGTRGIETADKLRLAAGGIPVPVLFKSAGYGQLRSRIASSHREFTDCVGRPIDPEELLFKVNALLSRLHTHCELLRVKEEFEKILDTIPDLISVVGMDNRIVRVNEAMARQLGRTKEALVGRLCYEVFHETDEPPAHCLHSETCLRRIGITREVYEQRLDGYYVMKTAPLYDAGNKVVGVVEIAHDITNRKLMEEKLRAISITDELTGLLNRRGFFSGSVKPHQLAARHGRTLSLFFVDLDGLKSINDRFGHKTGDLALMDTAALLRDVCRASDVIARIGGDEFAILMSETSPGTIDTVFRKHLDAKLDAYNRKENRPFSLALSVGSAHYDPAAPCSLDVLVSRADSMMYLHKRQKLVRAGPSTP